MQRQEIDSCHEIFGIDIRGSHIADIAAALTGKGRVEGKRQITFFRHCLGIKTRALLLDGAERTADGDRRQFPFHVLRGIQVSRQRDPVAVHESDFAVVGFIAFREGLIPFFCQY